MEWRHNEKQCLWELGYNDSNAVMYDAPEWHVVGSITDEFIANMDFTVMGLAALKDRMGSLPPPLAEKLPPDPPVTYMEFWGGI